MFPGLLGRLWFLAKPANASPMKPLERETPQSKSNPPIQTTSPPPPATRTNPNQDGSYLEESPHLSLLVSQVIPWLGLDSCPRGSGDVGDQPGAARRAGRSTAALRGAQKESAGGIQCFENFRCEVVVPYGHLRHSMGLAGLFSFYVFCWYVFLGVDVLLFCFSC